MAKVQNTFLKSKMNKDLDSRLIPSGEYRNAKNVQVSRSEGSSAFSLENILGNNKVFDFYAATGVSSLYCIGYVDNNQLNTVYIFLTDQPYNNRFKTTPSYVPTAKNFIFACNVQNNSLTLLVEGAFLNFSKTNPIYGANILENLLFWTDNRNQPRKINVDLANPNSVSNPTYYTTEDQISVAKYNPYTCMELYNKSFLSTVDGDYETTMKDVVSKFYPNGGAGKVRSTIGATLTNTIELQSFEGDIQAKTTASPGLTATVYDDGSSLAYIDLTTTTGEIIPIPSSEISTAVYSNSNPADPFWTITATSAVFNNLPAGTEIILNENPYYDPDFAGDPDYLEDKFSRFSYRFQFEDNEYSLIAPFTQIAFIPKQDGYFMYVKQDNIEEVDDQASTYRSTVASFVENKVNDIELKIPLPFLNYNISNSLQIKNIDILYKESDAIAIKVVDTVSINDVANSAGTFTVNGAVAGLSSFNIDNIKGGIAIGGLVTGFGIVGKPKITAFVPDNLNNPSAGGLLTIDNPAQTLVDDVTLNVNDPNYFTYNYQSKKPFKTLPEKDTTRVFDKIPVRALAQEVSGNRIIYGNYQDKHTPPTSLNYNVAVSDKSSFSLNRREGTVGSGGPFNSDFIVITSSKIEEIPKVGDFVSIVVGTGTIPENTIVTEVNALGTLSYIAYLTNDITGVDSSDIVLFEPGGDTENNTSIVEYPNNSLKTNRNYQVGVVLSDRYGRSSSVLLSNNKKTVKVGQFSFSGDTIYSAYKDDSLGYIPGSWPGDSLKLLFNETIFSSRNALTGSPGLYDGDITSFRYNPLGWYTYKIVVKQTEQEYYNVYLPGVMAAYPKDETLELGKTSHAVLINDNINKVPRDLSEVGPEQRQFRSSVQLFGRVDNTAIVIDPLSNLGAANTQYYPGRFSDTVSTISTVADLFDYTSIGEDAPRPNFFPQFYSLNSNPLIARISTNKKIGQTSQTNYETVTATVGIGQTTNVIRVVNTSGDVNEIVVGSSVLGPGFPEDLKVFGTAYTPPSPGASITTSGATTNNTVLTSSSPPSPNSSIQGVGIPDGTIVLSVTLAVSPSTVNTLTLNNVVSVGSNVVLTVESLASIEVDQSVTARLGSDITIVGSGTPGIQYLAVFETDPQESLLDIFWETSTSGLISDLNNAILNESSGGADLVGFNATPFTEAIADGANISSSQIQIVDNFGSLIVFGPDDETLELISQTDGYGDVSYFTLTQVGITNSYNITVNTAYFDNVFYGDDEDLRNFSLRLRCEINGLESFFEIDLELGNISPNITNPTFDGEEYSKQTSDTNTTIFKFKASNGSAANTVGSNFLSNRLNSNNVRILSVTNSSNVDVTGENYFELRNPGTDLAVFTMDFVNSGGINTPIDRYDITIRVADAGGENDSVDRTFVVDYGVKVENVVTYKKFSAAYNPNSEPRRPMYGPALTWGISQYFTIFQVTQGPIAAQGFYLYNGPWDRSGIVSQSDFDNLSFTYSNQPNTANTNEVPVGYPGPQVGYMVDGGENGGAGTSGGGIIKSGNNMTILGAIGATANLAFPNTGGRLIRANTSALVIEKWKEKCVYCVDIGDTSGSSGIYVQNQGGYVYFEDLASFDINQDEVDQFSWQVVL